MSTNQREKTEYANHNRARPMTVMKNGRSEKRNNQCKIEKRRNQTEATKIEIVEKVQTQIDHDIRIKNKTQKILLQTRGKQQQVMSDKRDKKDNEQRGKHGHKKKQKDGKETKVKNESFYSDNRTGNRSSRGSADRIEWFAV